jgi:hypothetical protein
MSIAKRFGQRFEEFDSSGTTQGKIQKNQIFLIKFDWISYV